MNGKNVNFGDKKIKESEFYKNKKVTNIDDIKEEPYGTKNSFIGYNDNDVIRPLCIKLPQTTGYVRKFKGNTTMSFNISSKLKKLKKYNQIWKRVEKLLKIEYDSKPVYGDNDKYIKTKIKIHGGSVNTNFQSKKMPKEKAPCKCLSITMLDFVVKAKEKYYPQAPLEECKYEAKKIKMEKLIDDDLEKCSFDEPDNEVDNETESGGDNDESNE